MSIKTFLRNNSNNFIISFISSTTTIIIIALLVFGLIRADIIGISLGTNPIVNNGSTGLVPTGTAAEQSQLIKTIDKASPAVVSVIITKKVQANNQNYQSYNPFFDLFGITNDSNQNNQTEEQQVGGGSGFFVSSDGYIVTNNHVVSDNDATYSVQTHDGKKYNAKVLARDETFDVAIIRIEGDKFSYLSFANSKDVKVGQTAIAIGNALAEFQNTVSTGIVSGLYRSITASDGAGSTEQLSEVIQTDAAINSGNSGGPLLDIRGNVIGINTAIETNAQNIGFAIPSNIVSSIVESVKKHGKIIKPYLGVRYISIDESVAKQNNLSVDYGILVVKGENSNELAVIPGSPADKAGIVENDIITSIDGEKLDNRKSFASIVQQKEVGQTVSLEIVHDGKKKTVGVKLEKSP
jgi:serine protease Do